MTVDDTMAGAVAALAADRAAVVPFVETYGDQLAAVVRRHLRGLGRGDVLADRDEVQGLVWEVALVLQENAAGWRPGGALPWNWAARAIRSRIAAYVGHAQVELDPDRLGERATPPATARHEVDFDHAADHDRLLGLVREALAEVAASDRNRAVHLEYRLQKALGDPSPARTVGSLFGLHDANVRQIDRRVRRQLSAVIHRESRYRELRDIPWLDGASTPVDDDDEDGAMAA